MPEGPELHMAARFINAVAKIKEFGGNIQKSEVSKKNPDVQFSAQKYSITAEARGKELKVMTKEDQNPLVFGLFWSLTSDLLRPFCGLIIFNDIHEVYANKKESETIARA